MAGMPRRYYDYAHFSNPYAFGYLPQVVIAAIKVAIASQLLYLINLLMGVYRHFSLKKVSSNENTL
jgi:hypothetical protein